MAHFTDDDAAEVFGRDMSEVWPYYRDLAERQRPAVERAIENLTGQSPADDTGTSELPDAVVDEGYDDLGDLPPEVAVDDPAEGELPDDAPPEA